VAYRNVGNGSHNRHRTRPAPFSLVIFVGGLLVGCAGLARRQTDGSVQQLQDALAKETATNQELEAKLAKLQLLLLEQDAQNKDLDRKLGEAIVEVVRAKAKLRSLESKAEAVSTLAEGEIALKTLKANTAGAQKDADYRQAEDLLKASGLELQKENYGGALYLATQAKSIINQGKERSTGVEKTALMAGEAPFTLPLSLRTVSSSKVREGPGLDAKVLFTLPQGAALRGHSYKGLWVRVSDDDGRSGWIYYSLIGGQ
jgi:hypothetical protein